MIKHYKDLTEEDKQRFLKNTIWCVEHEQHISWELLRSRMQKFLDDAYDDEKFPKMSADDGIDASYLRKDFPTKPDFIDFLIWHGRFATKNDYVEIS